MKKRILALLCAATLSIGLLTGCGGSSSKPEEKAGETETITVAASAVPHADILNEAAKVLKDQGYELKVTVFEDYVQPNNVVDSGEIDANYFQHVPYLDDFNAENKTNVVSVTAIHVEPLGLYGGKQSSLDALKK